MNKSELIDAVAGNSGLTKADSKRAIEAVAKAITDALKKGDNVQLSGIGTLKVSERKAREGRNPQTGEKIAIAAHKAVSFMASSALKNSVNS